MGVENCYCSAPSNASGISVSSSISEINLTVQTGYGYLISGNVILPNGDTVPNDTIISLNGLYAQGPNQTFSIYPYISSDNNSVPYAINVPYANQSYTLSINKYGSIPGVTDPSLYKLEPISVYVYSDPTLNIYNLNLITNTTGDSSTDDTITGLSPSIVVGPALLLGGKVYGLGNSQYTVEGASNFGGWYFKDNNGCWFNLRNFTTPIILTEANMILESTLPAIGLISGSLELTPSSSNCSAGCTISVTAPSGSNLWTSGDNVGAILTNENTREIVPGGPLAAISNSIENDNASFLIPSGIASDIYVLTLYKESAGVRTRFSIYQ